MTTKRHLFIGSILIALSALIYLGYFYISIRFGQQEPVSQKSISETAKIMIEKPSRIQDSAQNHPRSISLVNREPKIIQSYQPSEEEKILYTTSVQSLKYKPLSQQLPDGTIFRGENGICWKRETYKSNLQINRGETVGYLQDIARQYANSPYYLHYQETLELISQMQKEDEEFKSKYIISGGGGLSSSEIQYINDPDKPIPVNEQIDCYIYYLRGSYFYRGRLYKIEFGDGISSFMIPSKDPILSGARLSRIGVLAVPAILNILEDRRPIIVADDTKMPAVFYRYQDAAVEILQQMFIKAERPFPVEILSGEYFSEYLAKQTPDEKQRIINDIKAWVEESMKNSSEPEQQPK
jgi:hypothetical protein